MLYIYIDESGDLGTHERSSRFLVMSALIVKDPAQLDRIVKNMRRYKFRKQLEGVEEIKADKSKPELIRHMLQQLSATDARVFHIVLEKRKVYSRFLLADKNKLYNFAAGKIAQHLPANTSMEIRIDKSKGKQLLREDFNHYFTLKCARQERPPQIFHSNSHSWTGLQFADVLAWSAFQKFEHDNSSYLDELQIPQEMHQVW